MNPFVSVQDMDQSEDKLHICVTMTDGEYIITGNTHESIRLGVGNGVGNGTCPGAEYSPPYESSGV
jgi:hypothetical protein